MLLALGGVLIVTKKNNKPVVNQQTTCLISAKIIADNGQLIDVSTPEEYASWACQRVYKYTNNDYSKRRFNQNQQR